MELWIRSKNKQELIKVNRIALDNVGELLTFDEQGNEINLGKYIPYEKALKILNEIQFSILVSEATFLEMSKFKEDIELGNVFTNVRSGVIIYEMPEK